MNSAINLNKFAIIPANLIQPTSTRFAPNLETIQNALKHDKKLHCPNVTEFEKVRDGFFFLVLSWFNFTLINRFVP